MKCSTMVLNHLGIGVQLLINLLGETDQMVVKNKDGSTQVNLRWRQLISFECFAIAMGNPNLVKLMAKQKTQDKSYLE